MSEQLKGLARFPDFEFTPGSGGDQEQKGRVKRKKGVHNSTSEAAPADLEAKELEKERKKIESRIRKTQKIVAHILKTFDSTSFGDFGEGFRQQLDELDALKGEIESGIQKFTDTVFASEALARLDALEDLRLRLLGSGRNGDPKIEDPAKFLSAMKAIFDTPVEPAALEAQSDFIPPVSEGPQKEVKAPKSAPTPASTSTSPENAAALTKGAFILKIASSERVPAGKGSMSPGRAKKVALDMIDQVTEASFVAAHPDENERAKKVRHLLGAFGKTEFREDLEKVLNGMGVKTKPDATAARTYNPDVEPQTKEAFLEAISQNKKDIKTKTGVLTPENAMSYFRSLVDAYTSSAFTAENPDVEKRIRLLREELHTNIGGGVFRKDLERVLFKEMGVDPEIVKKVIAEDRADAPESRVDLPGAGGSLPATESQAVGVEQKWQEMIPELEQCRNLGAIIKKIRSVVQAAGHSLSITQRAAILQIANTIGDWNPVDFNSRYQALTPDQQRLFLQNLLGVAGVEGGVNPHAPASRPAGTGAEGIPLMITAQMEAGLLQLGYSQPSINRMRPEDAHTILTQRIVPTPPPIPIQPPPIPVSFRRPASRIPINMTEKLEPALPSQIDSYNTPIAEKAPFTEEAKFEAFEDPAFLKFVNTHVGPDMAKLDDRVYIGKVFEAYNHKAEVASELVSFNQDKIEAERGVRMTKDELKVLADEVEKMAWDSPEKVMELYEATKKSKELPEDLEKLEAQIAATAPTPEQAARVAELHKKRETAELASEVTRFVKGWGVLQGPVAFLEKVFTGREERKLKRELQMLDTSLPNTAPRIKEIEQSLKQVTLQQRRYGAIKEMKKMRDAEVKAGGGFFGTILSVPFFMKNYIADDIENINRSVALSNTEAGVPNLKVAQESARTEMKRLKTEVIDMVFALDGLNGEIKAKAKSTIASLLSPATPTLASLEQASKILSQNDLADPAIESSLEAKVDIALTNEIQRLVNANETPAPLLAAIKELMKRKRLGTSTDTSRLVLNKMKAIPEASIPPAKKVLFKLVLDKLV